MWPLRAPLGGPDTVGSGRAPWRSRLLVQHDRTRGPRSLSGVQMFPDRAGWPPAQGRCPPGSWRRGPPTRGLTGVAAVSSRPSMSSLLLCGDAGQLLALLPEDSVQTVITSPPYWSLRDYDTEGQIGRDDRLSEYVDSIVGAFEELKRVLRSDGTVWLNVGDAFTSGNRRYRAPDRKNRARAMSVRPPTPDGLKPKDLIGLPWRLAFALQDAGWWVRSEVIWNKPNAHPESVRDRPTKAHETLFLLSKSQNYHYDVQAVQGPNGRRLRTVWDIPTEPQTVPQRAGGGSPGSDAAVSRPAVRLAHQLRQRGCPRPVRRLGDDAAGGAGTWQKVGWYRAEPGVRGSDRAPDGRR